MGEGGGGEGGGEGGGGEGGGAGGDAADKAAGLVLSLGSQQAPFDEIQPAKVPTSRQQILWHCV